MKSIWAGTALLCLSVALWAPSAKADVVLAFEANSVGVNPLFSLKDADPGPGVDLTLSAANTLTLTLTVEIDGMETLYTNTDFDFFANVAGETVIPGTGTIWTLENITFSFSHGGMLVASAAHDSAQLFLPELSTAASFTGSTDSGGLYTVGPVLQDLLDSNGLGDQVLGPNQDFSFTLAGIELVGGTPSSGGTLTANSSFVGTATLIPETETFAGLLALGVFLGLARRRVQPV